MIFTYEFTYASKTKSIEMIKKIIEVRKGETRKLRDFILKIENFRFSFPFPDKNHTLYYGSN